jgi:hypothetical protein
MFIKKPGRAPGFCFSALAFAIRIVPSSRHLFRCRVQCFLMPRSSTGGVLQQREILPVREKSAFYAIKLE